MMSLAAVRIFTQVVEAGSFSAAGRRLGLAPSSVSRQVADLEDELGARLFHRTTRRLSLTEPGQVFYARAGKILVDLEEAKLAVAQPGGAPSGILRLTVPGSLGRLHLVPAIADFQEGHPAVKVGLVVTDRLVDLVEEGLDLAIRVGRQRDSSLVARRITTSRRLVCAAPSYLAKAGTPQEPAELASHDCLTFRSHPGANLWRFRGSGGEHQARVSGPLFANDGEALVSAAVAGLGLVLVPEWLVGPDLRAGRLQEVLSDYRASPDATPLYALYHHRRHLPAKVRAFVDYLATRFAPPYDWGGGPV
jgi:DNA-binding transcriptional LysR family regulator